MKEVRGGHLHYILYIPFFPPPLYIHTLAWVAVSIISYYILSSPHSGEAVRGRERGFRRVYISFLH